MNTDKHEFEWIPNFSDVEAFLDCRSFPMVPAVNETLERFLLRPAKDILARPSKGFRSRLVEVGFRISSREVSSPSENQKQACELLSSAIEMIHAGSLVIDDIHDKSEIRRGEATLHLKYGLSNALNAGNWMYFWPLIVIRKLDLKAEKRDRLYDYLHKILTQAHFGQALDIGMPIDEVPQAEVADFCMTSMELKSGALMSLALVTGAVIAGAPQRQLDAIEKFGRHLGLALQMFDDLGNVPRQSKGLNHDLKKYEDLALKRPSWVWATAAKRSSKVDYENFVSAVKRLPDDSLLLAWLEIHEVWTYGRQEAASTLQSALSLFRQDLPQDSTREGWEMLEILIDELKNAYE